MDPEKLFERYQELQTYVGWTTDDTERIRSVNEMLQKYLPGLVDDFYSEIERHPHAMKVITGGQQQINRLKGTLVKWLQELLAGPYNSDYVARRWKVGWRHVEIGLDQVYTNVALSRLRKGLLSALEECWTGTPGELLDIRKSLNLLIDLDLAIIEDAYQGEYVAREQRLAQNRTLGRIAANAPCMIVVLRVDNSILYFSPYAEELTGYAANDVLGQSFAATFIADPGLRDASVRRATDILAGTPERGFECPVHCRDGSQRWMVWNAQRLFDFDHGPAILMVGQDITSLKLAQEQALQSERLAAIGQMMTGLAHESGNALARSQACLEMLTFAVENQPKALNLIERIQLAQDHLKQLYDEVRNYAAPLKLDLEDCKLPMIWRQAWDNLALSRQNKSVTLSEDLGGLELRLRVDPFRLGQVFRNILDNALAACAETIEIKVACSRVEIAGQPAFQIAFRDNGPGLSAEQRQRIFDPFFTTKTKGTGLGMAIAKRIVEAHAGSISVGSNVEHGAEILVTLPCKEP
jgi:two-component system, LuxR family, sensor kinase FixL